MNKNTQWIQIKAVFESDNALLAEELLSDIFFSLGIKGVVCEVPLPEPAEGYASDALPLPRENSVSGYLPDTRSSKDCLENIKQKSADLHHMGIHVTIKTNIVDQEDWAESWKEFFFVTKITDHIVIKPEWRNYSPGPDDIVIEIDPGMAFGTGTHPTTSMCITMIETFLKPGMAFLDVGTGSGILMITAAKLGARHLTGIDTDEVAVNVAKENLEKNGISSTKYHIEQGTLKELMEKAPLSHSCSHRYDHDSSTIYDMVAANIIAEVILDIIPHIHQSLKKDGKAILSGIITDKKSAVISCLKKNGFSISQIITQGEWVGITAESITAQKPELMQEQS